MKEALQISARGNTADRNESDNMHCRMLNTPAGPLFAQDQCPAWLVEKLRAESGLRAFTRHPEREHQLLLAIAKRADNKLTLAYTPAGEIVGQVTLAPADGWWEGLENAYEIGIEVSSGWRRLNIAHSLLALALAPEAVEDMIILALGLASHWDLKGLGLSPFRYRELIAQHAASYGFIEYPTSEPNVRSDPANILLARIGTRVNQERISQFFLCLLRSDDTDSYEVAYDQEKRESVGEQEETLLDEYA